VVNALLPTADPKAMELRCSLLLIRDRASAAMRGCCPESHRVLLTVEQLASAYAFQPMPVQALECLRYLLVRLAGAAHGLETFSQLLSAE